MGSLKHQERPTGKLPTMNQRRTVLKGIALPAIWATPLVQSVVLPVHAQTSETDNCPRLSISGFTETCPVVISETVGTVYRLDDSGPCPVLTSTRDNTPQSGRDVLQVLSTRAASNQFNINVRRVGQSVNLTQNCEPPLDGTENGPVTFEALSGALWQADFTITAEAASSSISISTIALSPV